MSSPSIKKSNGCVACSAQAAPRHHQNRHRLLLEGETAPGYIDRLGAKEKRKEKRGERLPFSRSRLTISERPMRVRLEGTARGAEGTRSGGPSLVVNRTRTRRAASSLPPAPPATPKSIASSRLSSFLLWVYCGVSRGVACPWSESSFSRPLRIELPSFASRGLCHLGYGNVHARVEEDEDITQICGMHAGDPPGYSPR
ncbi:hypothetical protein GW17_00039625 [Ensete ventricosum]|nr:hypothetical protein GW17_00039625 [Ensete ventricosum]